jgi:hypothetical protein
MNIAGLSGVTKVVVALAAGGVLAGAIALGANVGKGGGSAPPAQLVAATATSVSEATAPASGGPAVTPRTDCLADENAYDDPDGRFSLCYPKIGVSASTHEPLSGPKRSVLSLREPPSESVVNDAWKMTVSWSDKSGLGLGMPSERTCASYTSGVTNPTSSQFVRMTIGGRVFTGCLTTGNLSPDGPPIPGQVLMLLSPLAEDGSEAKGFVLVNIHSTGPEVQQSSARSESVLKKLRVR